MPLPRLFGFLQKKDDSLVPFQSHSPPADLAVGSDDGELYWKGKRLKRSNFSGPRLGALILGSVTAVGIVLTAIANWDKIKLNLGFASSSAPASSTATENAN